MNDCIFKMNRILVTTQKIIIHQILIEQQYLMMWPLVFCCCGFQVETKNRYYCNNPSYETKKTKATKIKQSRTSFSRHFLTLCSEAISSIKTKVLRRKLFCASFSKRISESNRHSHETILYIRLRIFIQDLGHQNIWKNVAFFIKSGASVRAK